LRNIKATIHHIDNPLVHIGLESSRDFIRKTREGINNLLQILESYENKKDLINSVKLLRYADKVKSFGLENIVVKIFSIFERQLLNNLTGSAPNLRLFDFYKLGYLITCMNSNK